MATSGEGVSSDAPRAEDVAIHVDLPPLGTPGEGHDPPLTFDGFSLEAVDPNSKVHPSHDIVRDRKTGKHYKKVAPSWSAARAAQTGKGQPTAVGRRNQGTHFSVGHTFGSSRAAEVGTAGRARTPINGDDSPVHAHGMAGADMDKLVEKLRSAVREEVRLANLGHADHLERVVADIASPPTNFTSEKNSSGSKTDIVIKDTDKSRPMNETEAEQGLDTDSNVEEAFPNGWAEIRYKCREPFAEFLGCFVLITFGCGGNIQALLSPDVVGEAFGQYLSVSFGWGIGVAMGLAVSGGISGQLNPAVTLSLAIFRGFPWKKVPIYWFAQILGATLGGLMIIGLYINAFEIADPGKTQTTASLLTTFPQPFLEPPGARISGFYNEVYATAMLMMVIVAINDSSNTPPPEGMAPFALLWLVTGIGACLGWQTAYAINPARDLGPRIALSIVGYRGLWDYNAAYWIRTPCLGPLVGGILGCFIYDALIYTGADSPLNKSWRWSNVRWGKGSKDKIPAAIDQ